MNIMPWDYYIYDDYKENKRIVTQLRDNNLQNFRKGDIIKFDNGRSFLFSKQTGYYDWFLTEKDYKKFLKSLPPHKRNKKIPVYAANQYAIVIGKYRITKIKWKLFHDYGTVIMMLTGDKIGHIRKYFCCCPFLHEYPFPYKGDISPKLKDYEEIIISHSHDSNKGRNQLVSALYHKINKEK
jgi:hypothetical protein